MKFNSIDRYSTYLEDNQNVMKFLKIITTIHTKQEQMLSYLLKILKSLTRNKKYLLRLEKLKKMQNSDDVW